MPPAISHGVRIASLLVLVIVTLAPGLVRAATVLSYVTDLNDAGSCA